MICVEEEDIDIYSFINETVRHVFCICMVSLKTAKQIQTLHPFKNPN